MENGKYEISYEIYERFGGGKVKRAVFSAEDDFGACKKIAEHCNLYVTGDDFCETVEEAIEAGFEAEDLNESVYVHELAKENPNTVEDFIIPAMTDSDGQDFIFYIKRPDGSYLYDSEEDPEDYDTDWDD